ncbi:DUF4248 domain-containing protein [uncultured Parabacteroides sp.]|uniref:DUF4248 domain-containing protein n=1 Tax=uncultured Parabacteroides sp. TaxID=512312 RepID=UPI0025F26357|nr:DUF4248 domain-containing protein [uncultured Parabacteroides sp.]
MSPKLPSTRLGVLIACEEDLLVDLKKAGYMKGLHIITSRQVTIVLEHLGEPENWNIK